MEKSVGEATHYHTIWVVPYWQPTVVKLTQIGAHIFYRWAGDLGRPTAFQGLYAGLEPAPPMIAGMTTAEPKTAIHPAAKAADLTELANVTPPSAALPPPSKAQTFFGQRAFCEDRSDGAIRT